MKGLALFLLLALAGCAPRPPVLSSTQESHAGNAGSARAQVHTDLAANYFLRAQHGIALQELQEALAANSRYAPAYNILGLVYGDLREDSRAEDNFRRAVDLSPGFSEAHNNYGLFLCLRKREKEAMQHFEKALADPLYASPEKAQSNAGACSLEQGDLAAAEMYFVRAIKRAPNHPPAVLGLAETDFRQGRWLPARALLRQMAGLGELGAQALWLAIRIERRLGDRDAEAAFARQLQQRFPVSMQTQWLMTSQYDQMGSLL